MLDMVVMYIMWCLVAGRQHQQCDAHPPHCGRGRKSTQTHQARRWNCLRVLAQGCRVLSDSACAQR